MTLTARFAGKFDGTVIHRGADYFCGGRVSIDSASAARIVATVRGSGRYRVELVRDGRKIHASCTCPYFDVDLCKHIWAVLLMVEQRHLLPGEGLELVHRDIEDDDIDYDGVDDDDDDDDDYEEAPPYPVFGRTPPQAQRPAGKPKAATWREHIARLNSNPPAAYSLHPKRGRQRVDCSM